jgi:hypothetical protein
MQDIEEDCRIVILFIEMGMKVIIYSSVFVHWRIRSAIEVMGFMTVSGVTWRGHGYDVVRSVHQLRSQI